MAFIHNSRVLLVDNQHEPVAQMLGMLLKTKGYNVQTASSALAGLNQISPTIDLILFDTQISDIDCVTFCKQLKNNPDGKDIPIVIITNHERKEERLQLLDLGIVDYLIKPFELEELFIRIDGVLQRQGAVQTAVEDHKIFDTLEEIKDIINKKRISPYFQPIYNLENKEIFGVEMLSRPQTTTRLSNPEVLFKEALRLGLYIQVEMMIWQKAIDVFREQAYTHGCHMFLNCNPYLVEHNQYALVKSMVQSQGISTSRVYLELTERSSISEYSMFYEKLNQYREGGFSIAVNDVGGGYSSLETIVHTRPQAVKIDRQITTEVSKDTIKQSIIKLLVAFCRENHIVCIAEGIETKQDLDTVIELGVDAGQGYYLCRPKENLMECFH